MTICVLKYIVTFGKTIHEAHNISGIPEYIGMQIVTCLLYDTISTLENIERAIKN